MRPVSAIRVAPLQRPSQVNPLAENHQQAVRYASLFRRLMAIVYDLFLLIALLFIATAVAMIATNGEAIEPGQAIYPFYLLYLLAISFVFFGWFWTHGGQTLGLKTWKIRVQQENGQPITWTLALIRFVTAVASWSAIGLGYLWALFDPKKRSWHDIASRCVLVDLRPDG